VGVLVYLVKGIETDAVVRYQFGRRPDETAGIVELDKTNGTFKLVRPSEGTEAANEYRGARHAIARHGQGADGYPDQLSFMS
jgi:hypothetical protein